MFCAKCGAILAENAKKCGKCGAPVRIRPAGAEDNLQKTKRAAARRNPAPPSPDPVEDNAPEEIFMDPVFFEEADENLDVDAIIRIARGEDPEEGSGAIRRDRDDPQEIEEGEPDLDMPTYLESLPLMEKARRKLAASFHRREEAADEKRLRSQIRRAEKYFAENESEEDREDEPTVSPQSVKRAPEESAETVRLEREREQARIERERLLRAEREEKVRLEREREEKARLEREREEKARARAAAAEPEAPLGQEYGRDHISADERLRMREEIRIETARRLRRCHDEETDGFDRFLGKYGLSREMAVRLATLFLIAILSVIYVLGGGGRETTGTMQAGDAATGAPADQAQPSGQIRDGEDAQEENLPTGGGEFGNTQSDTQEK